MKQPLAQLRVLVLLVCTGLFLCALPYMAIAAGNDNVAEPLGLSITTDSVSLGVSVSTEEELRDVLRTDAGGTVTLTDDIYITYSDYIYELSNPLEIEMGDFSITIEDCGLVIRGPVSFSGSGSRAPLFTINGYLSVNDGVSIETYGDGATAIHLMPEGNLYPNYSRILVSGQESTAIRADGEVGINNIMIDGTGENTTGILCDGKLYLAYSHVKTKGIALLSKTGEYELDCDYIFPMRDEYDITRREARLDFQMSNGLCSAVGDSLDLPDSTGFMMISRPVGTRIYGSMPETPLDWDASEVDTGTPGSYTVTCIPRPRFQIPMSGLEPFQMPYHVVDPAKPFLVCASARYEGGVELVIFGDSLGADELKLSLSIHSDDNWKPVDFEQSEWFETRLLVNDLPIDDETYFFRLEVIGGPMEGVSNVLEFFYSTEDPNRDGGGDRDGDSDPDEPPPEPPLPPETPDDPPDGDDDTDDDDHSGGTITGGGGGGGGTGNDGGTSRRDGDLPREETISEVPANAATPPPAAPAPAGVTAFATATADATDSPDPTVTTDAVSKQTQQSHTDSRPVMEPPLEPDAEPAMSDEPAAPDESSRTTAGNVTVPAACVTIVTGGAFTFRRFKGRWRK